MRRSMSDATRLVPPDTGSTVSFMRLGHDQTLRLESPTNPIRKSADLRQTMWLLVSPSSFQMLPRIHDRRLHLRLHQVDSRTGVRIRNKTADASRGNGFEFGATNNLIFQPEVHLKILRHAKMY
ncbi:uncharacterized protein LOC105280406 [Ooceraea biroi]|uniref:uncharacterized protein LOC105280406 n=1 Tax=Ooceraea biroi TaxID=2015173 RepID=UPI000F0734D7|nr:uncharacterized protein LOC105280406 [Ooceraea biroi]